MRAGRSFGWVAVLLMVAGGCGGELLGDDANGDGTDEGPGDVDPIDGLETPGLEAGTIPENIDRETLDLVRVAIDLGLAAGKDLVTEGINEELARQGIDREYVGGQALTEIPDDAVTQCPYVENAHNDGSTAISCRLLAEEARDRAYVHEADALARLRPELGPEFDTHRELHESWLENGLASGIDGEYVMAVRLLREAALCDQAPTPIESSREQGIALGRQLFDPVLAAQVAATPITECDIDNGIVAPAVNAALAALPGHLTANPLCAGYEPTEMDDRAAFGQARNDYAAGMREGIAEGAVIGAEQLFRTWICQVPQEAGGGGGGGGDPLVLDLDGDGVRTSSAVRGVTFRLGGLWAERTGWVRDSADALLAIDHDGNGLIDGGAELFGDASWAPDGLPESNGLLALARYDAASLGGNGDGKIDINDAVWGALLLWTDRDLDGQTDAGELAPASSRVASIGLDYVTESGRQIASFDTTGGATLAAVDVWLDGL